MKINYILSNIFFIVLSINTCAFFPSRVMAADVENCLLCHKYSGLGRIDETGRKRLFYLNENSYNHSVHGRVRCKDCHKNVEEFPHVDLEKVDCASECHIVEPSVDKKFSHSKMIEEFEKSVHGKRLNSKPEEYPEDLPSCTYCHQNRILTPAMAPGGKIQGIAREILNRCLGCHEDERWTRTYYIHMSHRLKQRRSSRKMVELCASCHEDEKKMKRHGLEATGTFRDTFHWQAIKYGDPNAPHCIDCHAPVGYFSHDIMSKSDPGSAIYKDNLVQTCSNQFGLQKCHPAATPSFAQGKIHPSGEKTRLFDLKLAKFNKQEMIRKGLLQPFKSLLAQKAQEELTPIEYYQNIILQLIKYFYMLLIGGLISFMIAHQILDFFATRREMKKGGHS